MENVGTLGECPECFPTIYWPYRAYGHIGNRTAARVLSQGYAHVPFGHKQILYDNNMP